MWKAYFHISNPADAPSRESPLWDELHKVRPLLDEYLRRCVANISDHGRRFSIDEITIGFQGHHARLKMRCGKFKRAGDGFQVRRGGGRRCIRAVSCRLPPSMTKRSDPICEFRSRSGADRWCCH